MAPETSTSTVQPPPESTDEMTVKKVHKRYEVLTMIRTKAINGKGAWYWTHLEPVLVQNPDSGLPKAVKIRCSLCDAVFSASNPSRTASEHLKRRSCRNFNSDESPKPITSISPAGVVTLSSPTSSSSPQLQHNHRKRSYSGKHSRRNNGDGGANINSGTPSPVARLPVDVPAFPTATAVNVTGAVFYSPDQQQLPEKPPVMLSGGKEDLIPLAMFEDSVKKLKRPKSLPYQTLTKSQIDSSLELLADWVYESCGSVLFSSLEHPKFNNFLNKIGLPPVSRRDFAGERLDLKYKEAKAESEARIRDAMFFQISSDGWKSNSDHHRYHNYHNYNNHLRDNSGEFENLVNLCVNLPNGSRVFRRAVFTSGYVFAKNAEDVLRVTIREICGDNLQQCVGIVSDRFKSTSLRNLENEHHWMINLACQFQGVYGLIKDFSKELALFSNVTNNCFKVANFINNKSHIKKSFLKYQLQEYGRVNLLRVPVYGGNRFMFAFEPVFNLVEDVLTSSRALQLVSHDEGYKIVSMEDQVGMEIEEMMRHPQFWKELEAVHSLVKLIKQMAEEIKKERPRIGQCLPLWEDLRLKIKNWCVEFRVDEDHAHKVFDKRFKRNYHPAWAAAFILDPLYLIRESSGKYLPPFKYLTSEQEKDVDKLITRLVSRDEAHIALMELMKWRTEGLEPVYAQAVQLKQRDPITGKMKIANPQSSRLIWETYLTEFKVLKKVAVRLIFLHATSCGFKSNWSFSKGIRSRNSIENAQKMIFIAAHSKLVRRDLLNDEDKDSFFAVGNGDDDVLNDVMFDASSL